MNSRQRIRAALAHEETDRVPIDLGAMGSSSICAPAYHALKRSLGISGGEVRVVDVNQLLPLVEEPVRERLGVDVLPLPHYHASWFPEAGPTSTGRFR